MTNQEKADRLEELAFDAGYRDHESDAALLRKSAAMWRGRDAEWRETDAGPKMTTAIYKNHLVIIREVGPILHWWAEIYAASRYCTYKFCPTLDAAKAAAIQWVDGQEGK